MLHFFLLMNINGSSYLFELVDDEMKANKLTVNRNGHTVVLCDRDTKSGESSSDWQLPQFFKSCTTRHISLGLL